MLKRRDFALLAATSPLAFMGSAAYAATPKDTLVVAKDISDIITLDPGEMYEITGGEVVIAVYDSLLRYEPEDVTKIIGGTAQSWSATEDGKEYTFKIRPGLKFESGGPVTAGDIAWSMQRGVIPRQDASLPARAVRLDQGQRQQPDHRARPGHAALQDPHGLRAIAGL